jgi:hypothetical protein
LIRDRPPDRTIFLVDGFNLYHSLCRARDDLRRIGRPSGTRWLDLIGLCRAHLSAVSRSAALTGVVYFTAFVPWSQDKRLRHEWYVECLKATGVKVRLGRFKAKEVICGARCGLPFITHEEKETDVAIGVALLGLFQEDLCDTAVVLSADSDYVPAVREARRLFPIKRVHCAFPYGRASFHLEKCSHARFSLSRNSYVRHQLPDPFPLTPFRSISKPAGW